MTQPFDPQTGGIQMSTWKIGSWVADAGQEVAVFSFSESGHREMSFGQLEHSREAGGCGSPENVSRMLEFVRNFEPYVIINQTPYDFPIAEALQPLRGPAGPLMLACLRNSLFSVKLNLDDYRNALVPDRFRPITRNRVGDIALQMLHRRRHARQLRTILDHHDRFVMFGPPNHEEIEYFIGKEHKEQLVCIPNSIPEVLADLPAKEKSLLYVGRLATHQKRAELLLPLWKKLHKMLPDWTFDIVGDGPYRGAMEEQALAKELPRIVFHGKQNPYPYYEKAAITVMTSSFEGFPNVTIEAQSRGAVPVLMDSFPLASWVVNHGEDAILLPPFDLDQMGASILELAADDVRRERMQHRALANAQRFHIETVGKQWLELLQAAA